MRKILLVLLVAITSFVACKPIYDREAIRSSVLTQLGTYPESTLLDIYKSFFQDAFGPGHLLTDRGPASEAKLYERLVTECEMAKDDYNGCPDYELVGSHGRFYRANLSLIYNDIVPIDAYFSAFFRSAKLFTLPVVSEWQQEWNVILEEIQKLGLTLPGFEEDKATINSILMNGEYISHHSIQYNESYHPHYRLIERSIFEKEIMPFILAEK